MHEIDGAIARRASAQHGLITRRQAEALGATNSMIAGRRRSGRWQRVEHGVYHVAGAPFTWHTRVLASCFASGGIASHRTAAVLHGMPGFREGPPELTIARGRTFRRPNVRAHESTDLDLARVRPIEGIPTTGVARLLVDLGAVCSPRAVEDAVFDAIDRKLVSWTDLLEMLVLHARRGRRGVAALRLALERNYGLAVPQSQLEVVFDHLLEDAGLPRPDRQVDVHDGDGFIGRVDFAYRWARVVIEVDGRTVHARRAALEADRQRHNRLQLAGWLPLVFTSETIMRNPAVVVQQVRTALRSRTTDAACVA